jgi:DNA-binding transcriptional LysR family regulator
MSDTMSLKRLDLNLLVTFDALWRERSVTRAARRLNVAQPTVSNALGRLREVFDDQLFVRAPRGVEPTERCDEVAKDVQEALRHIESALDSSDNFKAELSDREFRIGSADYFDLLLLPDLIEQLSAEAPGVNLRLQSIDRERGIEMLDGGELDFLLHHDGDASKRIGMEKAFDEFLVFTARAGHPQIDGPPDLATYTKLSHINFSQRGEADAPIDDVLAALGHSRRVAVTNQHMSTLANIVQHTDMVGSLPSRLAGMLASSGAVQVHPLPFEIPSVQLNLYWNRRFELDGANRWMRQTLLGLCRALPEFDAYTANG